MCKLTPKFISTSTAKSPLKPIARSNGHIPTRSKQLMENSAKQKSVCQRLSHMRVSLSKLELRLLLEPLANLIKRFSRKPKQLHSLCLLLEDTLKRNVAKIVQKNLDELTEMFVQLLSFRAKEKHVKKFQEMNDCENAAISAFLALKFTLLTVYQFANRFYEAFNTLALPHFDRLLSIAPKLLDLLNASITNEVDLLINGSEKGSLGSVQCDRLVQLLVTFINKCAKHSFYFNEERGELVHESLINHLDSNNCRGNEQLLLLADCIYQVADAFPTQPQTGLPSNGCLPKASNPNRRRANPLLPVIVHHFNQLAKNSENHPKVTEECAKTISVLREKFGFDLFDQDDQLVKARQKGKKRRHKIISSLIVFIDSIVDRSLSCRSCHFFLQNFCRKNI
uniref:HEAT repeat-containing protein 1 n=1 Tax=Ditylenchus dipsaci TaxID=166011 RepID=A0A915EJC0_9BILA